VDEPLRVGQVGGGVHLSSLGLHGRSVPVVDVGRSVQTQPGVAVNLVVVGEELPAVRPSPLDGVELAGKIGRYFRVLNCASEYGLSLLTRGRSASVPSAASFSRASLTFTASTRPRQARPVAEDVGGDGSTHGDDACHRPTRSTSVSAAAS
jgi:hypothetical protein